MTRDVLFCTDVFWDAHADSIVSIDPTIEVVRLVGDEHVTRSDLDRMTIAYFSPDVYPERTSAFMGACLSSDGLRWMHTMSAGTDHPVFGRLRDRGVTVTSSAGASAPSIAQTVMLYLLAMSRDLPRLLRSQAAHRWDPGRSRDLHGMRLGIIGLGSIGAEVARLATAFDMDVVGIRRSPGGDEPCETWRPERFEALLQRSDVVAVTAPLTDDTRGMFDARAFAAMPAGAWFVNVGRGEIVVEDDLVESLASGHLGAAALDVFSTEPLPADSALWAFPNVILTPHCSGSTDRSNDRATEAFLENLARRGRGDALRNVT